VGSTFHVLLVCPVRDIFFLSTTTINRTIYLRRRIREDWDSFCSQVRVRLRVMLRAYYHDNRVRLDTVHHRLVYLYNMGHRIFRMVNIDVKETMDNCDSRGRLWLRVPEFPFQHCFRLAAVQSEPSRFHLRPLFRLR